MSEAEEKQVKKKTPISMAKIIFLSLVISAAVVAAYFCVESICVHSVKDMPYQNRLWGGDCYTDQGIFWSITYLTPVSAVDDPAPAEKPIIGCSMPRVFIVFAEISLILWAILCLFSKRGKTVVIAAGSLAVIFLAIVGLRKLYKFWQDTPKSLSRIQVVTSDVHEGVYNGLRYPEYAIYLIPAGEEGVFGRQEKERMETAVAPENVSRQQLKALITAAQNLRAHTDTDRKNGFAYGIYVIYQTNKGYERIYISGNSGFPEEWAEFAKLTNELCGKAYLREHPEHVVYSDEWLAETYGICDENMPQGITAEEFRNRFSERGLMQMKRFCGLNDNGEIWLFDPQRMLDMMQPQ